VPVQRDSLPQTSPETPDGPEFSSERASPERAGLGDRIGDGLAEALAVIGDRWSLAVVERLLDRPLRFGALQGRLPSISSNVLTQRLRALEASGVLAATPYSERPRRYEYALTDAGRELAGPLRLLGDWGARRAGTSVVEPPRHDACGTPLQVRWYCPVCEQPVAPPEGPEEEDLYFA
jgi:DNA-binding HxlR family transcriptional regulator